MRMIDQEKVITALECCKDVHQAGCWASGCISCGYANKHRPDCFLSLADDAAELLKEQPEIVRCKDCKHYKPYRGRVSGNLLHECEIFDLDIDEPDWFCANGERRDDDD